MFPIDIYDAVVDVHHRLILNYALACLIVIIAFAKRRHKRDKEPIEVDNLKGIAHQVPALYPLIASSAIKALLEGL